jgi:hypothetical protein
VPGYKALPDQFSGDAAEHVRYAEVLQRAGDPAEAVRMLESTLDAFARSSTVLPGWLCGRLAALYRTLKRYDDEVLMLERYRESQSSEDARSRFDARLSKARAIAERKRRTDTYALSSVRRVINGRKDEDMPAMMTPSPDDGAFSPETIRSVRTAFATSSAAEGTPTALSAPLATMCREARERGHPPERLVLALKEAWQSAARPPQLSGEAWEALYRVALTQTLALYFNDLVS